MGASAAPRQALPPRRRLRPWSEKDSSRPSVVTFPASRWLRLTAFGLVPGLAAAIQLSGLLFFLNPDLPFTIAAVLRGIAVYGLLFGGLTVAVHLAVARTDERRAQRLLPWGLTAVLGLAALVDWYNASYFGFYLPPGINERLIKAAFWLTLAALITFYTALLHALHGRRYG